MCRPLVCPEAEIQTTQPECFFSNWISQFTEPTNFTIKPWPTEWWTLVRPLAAGRTVGITFVESFSNPDVCFGLTILCALNLQEMQNGKMKFLTKLYVLSNALKRVLID